MAVSLGGDTSAFGAQGCNRVKNPLVKTTYSVLRSIHYAIRHDGSTESLFFPPSPSQTLQDTHTHTHLSKNTPLPNVSPPHSMLLNLNHTCTQRRSMFTAQRTSSTTAVLQLLVTFELFLPAIPFQLLAAQYHSKVGVVTRESKKRLRIKNVTTMFHVLTRDIHNPEL
jgi:hypothetical protein